jgi:hypothetical protein
MPLDVGRLLGSETWISAALEPRVGHALMTLWAESWRQIPCGSLPDHDAQLFRLSMRPDMKDWRQIRDDVRACFTLCSDGRLYHAMVCEMALECWLDKLYLRRLSLAGNGSRHGRVFDPTEIDTLIDDALRRLTRLNPLSNALRKKRPGSVNPNQPPGSRKSPGGRPNGRAAGLPPGSQVKEREGITPQSPHATACGQLGLVASDGAPFEHNPDGWPRWRNGVEAIGRHLGLGPWDEYASQHGNGEAFGLYEQRVRHAAGWPPAEQRSSAAGVPMGQALMKVVG